MPKPQIVVGFDQGYSDNATSSGFFIGELVDDQELRPVEGPMHVTWKRAATLLKSALSQYDVAAVCIDSPLGQGNIAPCSYRRVERVFSLGGFQKACKPGSSGSPVGQKLASAARRTTAGVSGQSGYVPFRQLRMRTHHRTPIVEGFPTAAMAVLTSRASLPLARRRKTDKYFAALVPNSGHTIGGVSLSNALMPTVVKNHDERMAVICAVIASWYVTQNFTAVGDSDGYFVMPDRTGFPAPSLALRVESCSPRLLRLAPCRKIAGLRPGPGRRAS